MKLPSIFGVMCSAAGLTAVLWSFQAVAESANYQVVRRRSVPGAWTQPVIVPGAAGAGATVIPSAPTKPRSLRTGADAGVRSATVHARGSSRVRKIIRLRLPGGGSIRIRPGNIIPLGKWRLKFLGEKHGAYWFEDIRSGRRLRFVRRPRHSRPSGR